MEENEKPFACSAEGCTETFTNEDRLTVHKKKHDMFLHLGNTQKSNVVIADQTPTPTRFLRNCEEVGLFQDLQNVNPFEETFRKAYEATKAGISLSEVDPLSVPSGGDDTLHTPHVFPHIPVIEDSESIPSLLSAESIASENEKPSPSRRGLESFAKTSSAADEDFMEEELIVKDDIQDSSSQSILKETKVDISLTESIVQQESNEHSDHDGSGGVQLLLKSPIDKVMHISVEQFNRMAGSQLVIPTVVTTTTRAAGDASTHSSDVTRDLQHSTEVDGSALVKLKLKQTLTSSTRTSASNVSKKTSIFVDGGKASSAESRQSNVLINRPKKTSSNPEDQEKRKRFLERNRAAAMRCREKRKSWIKELERRCDSLQSTNERLQASHERLLADIVILKAENANLKSLLLQHKNCSVSLGLAKSVYIGPVEADSTDALLSHQQSILPDRTVTVQTTAATPSVTSKILYSPSVTEQRQIMLLNGTGVKRIVQSDTITRKKVIKQTLDSKANKVIQHAFIIPATTSDRVEVTNGNKISINSSETTFPMTNLANIIPVGSSSNSNLEVTSQNQQVLSFSVVNQSNGTVPALVLPGVCLTSPNNPAPGTDTTEKMINLVGLNANIPTRQLIKVNPSVLRISNGKDTDTHTEKNQSDDSDIEVVYESSSSKTVI